EPGEQQDEAETAGHDEGNAPAMEGGDPQTDNRRDEDADIGAGIEDAHAQRPLLARKPFRYGLDRTRIGARLGHAEHGAGEHELQHGMRGAVQHGGDAPDAERDGHAEPRAHPVEQAAYHEQAHRIAGLERGDDIAVVDLAPTQILLDERLEHANDLTVDIVDGDDEEEQGADGPAIAPAGLQRD